MKFNNLFFHIHYCNYRHLNEYRKFRSPLTRTLQHHELILITGGKGSFGIEKKKFPLTAGMLLYIPSGVLQTIEIDIKDPICFMAVHFSYAQVSFNEGEWAAAEEMKVLPLQAVHKLKDYYQIEEVFKKLIDSWSAKLPGYEFVTKSFLHQLFIAIAMNIKKQHQNYSTSLKVEKIIQYMQQNIHHRVTLTELSDMVQLSPAYLSRTFKEITGYSIIEFFNKMKIDLAKEMILEGDRKIKEVAGALGFTDEFYFSRIFKRIEGISPSEFYSKNVHGA